MKSISILFDEGQDTGGPDFFGLAVLDNIDVNGKLVGQRPGKVHDRDRDDCKGKDKDNRHFSGECQPSRVRKRAACRLPTRSQGRERADDQRRAQCQLTAGACVTFIGDALLNDNPGHVVSFTACDLSALSTPLPAAHRQLHDRGDRRLGGHVFRRWAT